MKKQTGLVALLGFLGAMTSANVAYGEEMRTINISDVPVPRPEQLIAESYYRDGGREYTEKAYDLDNDGRLDLRFTYLIAKREGGVHVLIGPLEMTTYRDGINRPEEEASFKIIFDEQKDLENPNEKDLNPPKSEEKSPAYCPIPDGTFRKRDVI
ncbi:hypothetical protein HY449_04410 [Candidatus Pacearchaeota archaeon]|nr:hypothetical protein [Candidatus Pacearchaeota archaeon]